MSGITIFPVDRLELVFAPRAWVYATEKRVEIDAFFAALQRQAPAVWNGRVLLLHRQSMNAGVFRGDYLETDYASFSAWRAWGRPPAGVQDCFGAAAVIAADGGVLLGVMNENTAQAGRVYFPCGTPDPADVIDGRVDLDRSVARELEEETGLKAADFTAAPGWTAVVDGALIMQVKILRGTDDAETLRAHALAHLARERQPELAGIRIARSPADFDAAMPRFVTAFLTHHFSGAVHET
jgi:8-oxo-dGTP pyrophosphatase MutT (NUDIX family)